METDQLSAWAMAKHKILTRNKGYFCHLLQSAINFLLPREHPRHSCATSLPDQSTWNSGADTKPSLLSAHLTEKRQICLSMIHYLPDAVSSAAGAVLGARGEHAGQDMPCDRRGQGWELYH